MAEQVDVKKMVLNIEKKGAFHLKRFKVQSNELKERYILNAAAAAYVLSLFVIFMCSG